MPKRNRAAQNDSAGDPSSTAGPSKEGKMRSNGTATAELLPSGEAVLKVPQKRFFRQRAHANVFNDHSLDYPEEMDWSIHYPDHFPAGHIGSTAPAAAGGKKVEWADVGCGFGGLLMDLAPRFPDVLMLGMEIRTAVTSYVHARILATRQSQTLLPPLLPSDPPPPPPAFISGSDELPKQRQPGGYQNVSVIRANSMKHMPNFFAKGQLSKMFFLFPDPHFKLRKQKARIITTPLIAEYAHVLRPGGILYTVTLVKDLHGWMASHLDRHPLFQRIPDEELIGDPVLESARTATEEGRKVERNKGDKYVACYTRLEDDEA